MARFFQFLRRHRLLSDTGVSVYDLENLSLRSMTECGATLRRLHQEAGSLEDVCGRMVRHLYDALRAGDGRACMLVRAYKTHDAGALDAASRSFAEAAAGHALERSTKCLTLMASVGDEPEWNARETSRGHRALPLASRESLDRMPMVAQLVSQLGIDAGAVIRPDPAVIVDMQQRTFNVFHVEDATGSPWIPAQDFVQRYGVRSVVGFGTMLPSGDLFAIILFARVPISRSVAELFRPLSLAAKLSVLPFVNQATFAEPVHA